MYEFLIAVAASALGVALAGLLGVAILVAAGPVVVAVRDERGYDGPGELVDVDPWDES